MSLGYTTGGGQLLISLFGSFEFLFPLFEQGVLRLITVTRSTQFLFLQYSLFTTKFLAETCQHKFERRGWATYLIFLFLS